MATSPGPMVVAPSPTPSHPDVTGYGQPGAASTIGAGIGGCTMTGAGATTTGAGSGNPKVYVEMTPAFAAVIPRAARARIAIVFFIISIDSTRRMGRTSLQQHYRFVMKPGWDWRSFIRAWSC
jgi:hypothetical protein